MHNTQITLVLNIAMQICKLYKDTRLMPCICKTMYIYIYMPSHAKPCSVTHVRIKLIVIRNDANGVDQSPDVIFRQATIWPRGQDLKATDKYLPWVLQHRKFEIILFERFRDNVLPTVPRLLWGHPTQPLCRLPCWRRWDPLHSISRRLAPIQLHCSH